MAMSGKTSVGFNKIANIPSEPYRTWLVFEWEINAQSIVNNTSVVVWKLYLKADEGGHIYLGLYEQPNTFPWRVTINGVEHSGMNTPETGRDGIGMLASGTTTVVHTVDGTKQFNYSFSQQLTREFHVALGGPLSGSGSGELEPLHRASVLEFTGGYLGDEHTIIIVPKVSYFKHRLTFNCGDVAGYIAGSEQELSSSLSVKWTPQVSLSWQVTDSVMVPIQLTLRTYDANGQYVGIEIFTVQCKIPEDITPIVTTTVTDLTGYDAVYGDPVQSLSQAHVVVTGKTSYGSPLMRYTIIASGIEYVTDETDLPVYSRSGDYVVAGRIKDARGRIGLHEAHVNVLPYFAPAVTRLTVRRCDEDGTEHAQGEFVEATFSGEVARLNDRNSAQYVLRYKASAAEDYVTVEFPELNNVYDVVDHKYIFPADLSSSYDVLVTVSDNHGSATRSTVASTGFAFMDWHTSGTGLSFGKVAEKPNTMEIALTTEFIGPQTQLGNYRTAYVAEGSDGANMTGFDHMARISVINTYANSPLTFVFTRRNELLPMTVHVTLTNDNTLDPLIGFMGYEGANYGAYLVHPEPSIWDLYVARGSAYDFITLQSWHMAQYMESRVVVTFPATFASMLPDGAIQVPSAGGPNLADILFPVGSIVMRYDTVNPATLYPGTTWAQITARILRAAPTGGAIGAEGTLADGTGRTYIDVAVWRRTA